MPVMMSQPRYAGEPLSQSHIDITFTGSIYDLGSGPVAEFIITNPSKGVTNCFGSTFLMAAKSIENTVARDLAANAKMPVDEYQRALTALKKWAP